MNANTRFWKIALLVAVLFAPFGVASAAAPADCGEFPSYLCGDPRFGATKPAKPEAGEPRAAEGRRAPSLDALKARSRTGTSTDCGEIVFYICGK